MSVRSQVEWQSFIRQVLVNWALNNGNSVVGGVDVDGESIIVEIDESKFGKEKYHRGT